MISGPNPPRPPHGPHQWIINEEKTRSLSEIGERLQTIGRLLSERGYLKLDVHEVKPTDPCFSIIRYERMPRGELSLKLELMWEDFTSSSESTHTGKDISIE